MQCNLVHQRSRAVIMQGTDCCCSLGTSNVPLAMINALLSTVFALGVPPATLDMHVAPLQLHVDALSLV